MGKGGYAKRLPKEWYEKERESSYILQHVTSILFALSPEVAPTLATKTMNRLRESLGHIVVIDQGETVNLPEEGSNTITSSVDNRMLTSLLHSIDSTRMFSSNIWYGSVDNLVKDGKICADDDQIGERDSCHLGGSIIHHGTSSHGEISLGYLMK